MHLKPKKYVAHDKAFFDFEINHGIHNNLYKFEAWKTKEPLICNM